MFNFPPILIGAGEGSTAILDYLKGLDLENTFSLYVKRLLLLNRINTEP